MKPHSIFIQNESLVVVVVDGILIHPVVYEKKDLKSFFDAHLN